MNEAAERLVAAEEFDLDAARDAIAEGRPVVFRGVSFVRCEIHGRALQFVTDMESDPIQRGQREGKLYEGLELDLIKRVFPFGGTFVDIGANVGNHGLYAAAFLQAGRVIPFEPNPRAYRLLIANILANGLEGRFDLSRLGCGLSDRAEAGYAMEKKGRNLGSAKMLPGRGAIALRRADEALAGVSPDFIKIDVEGMEIGVLRGLAGVLERCSPWMLVEVDDSNAAAFEAWLAESGYRVEISHRRYRNEANFLLSRGQGRQALLAAEA